MKSSAFKLASLLALPTACATGDLSLPVEPCLGAAPGTIAGGVVMLEPGKSTPRPVERVRNVNRASGDATEASGTASLPTSVGKRQRLPRRDGAGRRGRRDSSLPPDAASTASAGLGQSGDGESGCQVGGSTRSATASLRPAQRLRQHIDMFLKRRSAFGSAAVRLCRPWRPCSASTRCADSARRSTSKRTKPESAISSWSSGARRFSEQVSRKIRTYRPVRFRDSLRRYSARTVMGRRDSDWWYDKKCHGTAEAGAGASANISICSESAV